MKSEIPAEVQFRWNMKLSTKIYDLNFKKPTDSVGFLLCFKGLILPAQDNGQNVRLPSK